MRLQYVGCGLYLGACLLIGNVVGQYEALKPIAERRGLGPGTVLGASIMRFDVAPASIGLLVGVTSRAVSVGFAEEGDGLTLSTPDAVKRPLIAQHRRRSTTV